MDIKQLCVLIAFSRFIFSITKAHFKDYCSDMKMHFSLETVAVLSWAPGEQNFNLE